MEMLQSIIEHMDRLEASAVTPDKGARPKADRQTETCVTCKCGWSQGHVTRITACTLQGHEADEHCMVVGMC